MNIEQKELINIIREELAEALGMDQQFSGATSDVEAENSLSQALVALKAAGYTREEVIEMIDAEYELQEDLVDDLKQKRQRQSNVQPARTQVLLETPMMTQRVCSGEGSRSRRYDPRNYVGRDVGRRLHGSDERSHQGSVWQAKVFQNKVATPICKLVII